MGLIDPPDSYWSPPEPSTDDLVEEAEFEAGELMREWEELGHMEVGIGLTVSKYGVDVTFSLDYVISNGVTYEIGENFDTIDQVRNALVKTWPLPDEYPDE